MLNGNRAKLFSVCYIRDLLRQWNHTDPEMGSITTQGHGRPHQDSRGLQHIYKKVPFSVGQQQRTTRFCNIITYISNK